MRSTTPGKSKRRFVSDHRRSDQVSHRPTHHENNANVWVVSLTTGREGDDSKGNHFYIAEYGGVLIRSAPNTLVAFRPQIYHGTTLPERSPKDDKPLNVSNFYQGGLSFVLPSGVRFAWKKRKEKWAKEEVIAKMVAGVMRREL